MIPYIPPRRYNCPLFGNNSVGMIVVDTDNAVLVVLVPVDVVGIDIKKDVGGGSRSEERRVGKECRP